MSGRNDLQAFIYTWGFMSVTVNVTMSLFLGSSYSSTNHFPSASAALNASTAWSAGLNLFGGYQSGWWAPFVNAFITLGAILAFPLEYIYQILVWAWSSGSYTVGFITYPFKYFLPAWLQAPVEVFFYFFMGVGILFLIVMAVRNH